MRGDLGSGEKVGLTQRLGGLEGGGFCESAAAPLRARKGVGGGRGEEGGVRGSRAPFPAVLASQVCEPQWLPVQSMTHCIVISYCERLLRGERQQG